MSGGDKSLDPFLTDIQSQISRPNNVVKDDPISFNDVINGFSYNHKPKLQCLSQNEINEITNNNYIIKPIKRHQYTFNKNQTCMCGGNMYKNSNGTEYVCGECGMEDTILGDEIEEINGISLSGMVGYNTSSDSATPIKISGPNEKHLQKQLQYRTSEYCKTQYRDTMTQLTNIVKKYNKYTIPINIVKNAGDLYYQIQSLGEIKRGDVRKGIMAACLLRICDKNGISRKRSMIVDMFSIQPSDLSNGEKLLDKLCSDGKIDKSLYIPKGDLEILRIEGFLNQYFIKLKLPMPSTSQNYFGFVKQLVRFTIKFKIAENSIPSSKCAGAIYTLSTRCKELNISMAIISKTCEISASTFKRYYIIVQNLLETDDERKKRLKNKLRHLFHKFNIPIA